LRDRKARRESYVGEWLPEPLLTEGEPGVRAEDVSFALQVVLERLSPLERVVFVLHSAFDLSFEEISPVARRDAVACRKIYSRARERVLLERPRFAVDREHHRALLRSFADAARGGDTATLAALLDDDVVLHGDGGGKALALKKPVVGQVAVAQFVIAVTRTLPADGTADIIELNGAPGLVLRVGGRPTVAILIESDGKRIHSVFGISNPDKLAAIAAARAV
jgi:RNA polymerase sigma-70 factor (ECF subfamily)